MRRAHSGRIAEVNRIRSPSLAAPRSRIFTRETSTAPIPVWIVAFGTMTMPDNTVSPIGKLEVLHLGKKCLGFQLNSLRQ